MRMCLSTWPVLLLLIASTLSRAEQKVAEGEYRLVGQSESGIPMTKTESRWVIYTEPKGHYRVESTLEGQPENFRVLQIEFLTADFLPTALTYELYQGDEAIPVVTVSCEFGSSTVICSGMSAKGEALPSAPFRQSGAFWVWIDGLGSLDLPWLYGGAINLAQVEKSNEVATIVVSGGTGFMIGDAINIAKLQATTKKVTAIAPNSPTPWRFSIAEKSPLRFVALENIDLAGQQIRVRHYSFGEGENRGEAWITTSGLVTKLTINTDSSIVLGSYKQYIKIVPELKVAKLNSNPSHPKPTQ